MRAVGVSASCVHTLPDSSERRSAVYSAQVLAVADWDDAERVQVRVRAEIMHLDVLETRGALDSILREDVAHEAAQVGVVLDAPCVCFEVCDIDRIKADKRMVQTQVQPCEGVAAQEPCLA